MREYIKILTYSIIFISILFTSNIASPATYYVDYTLGNDAGTTSGAIGSPWKTVTKVDSAVVVTTGDVVLFKRGETFGVSDSLVCKTGVTYGAYGTGAQPIIQTYGTVGTYACIMTAKTSVTLRSINFKHNGTVSNGRAISISTSGSSIVIDSCTISAPYYGIYSTANVTGLTVTNLSMSISSGTAVYGIYQTTGTTGSNYVISNFTSSYGGIYVKAVQNITIWNGVINNTGSGSRHGINLDTCSGVATIDSVTTRNTNAIGIYLLNGTLSRYQIHNCTVTNAGSSGIYIRRLAHGHIKDCVVDTVATGNKSLYLNSFCDSTVVINLSTHNSRPTSGAGIFITESDSIYISKFYSFRDTQGLYMDSTCTNIYVVDSVVRSSYGDGFVLRDTVNTVTFDRCWADSVGLKTAADSTEGDGFTCHAWNYNIKILNCLVTYAKCSGVAMVGQSSGYIYNSTFYGNGGDWRGIGGVDQCRGGIYIGCTGVNPRTGLSWIVKDNDIENSYPFEINSFPQVADSIWIDYNNIYPQTASRCATLTNTGTGWWGAWTALTYAQFKSAAGNIYGYEANGTNYTSNFVNISNSNPNIKSTSSLRDRSNNFLPSTSLRDFRNRNAYGKRDKGAIEYWPYVTSGNEMKQ